MQNFLAKDNVKRVPMLQPIVFRNASKIRGGFFALKTKSL
jgi:hypothetical protein